MMPLASLLISNERFGWMDTGKVRRVSSLARGNAFQSQVTTFCCVGFFSGGVLVGCLELQLENIMSADPAMSE